MFNNPPPPECIVQYSLDSCCMTNTVCSPDDTEKLASCTSEGRSYREGQVIYPKLYPCYKCICGPDFDENDIENSEQCRKIHCGIDQKDYKVQEGCIPIYYDSIRSCCPIGWRCRE